MLAMAKAGRGSAYYGQTAADLAEPFQTEFALLTGLCARGLASSVQVPAGFTVRMRNDYERVEGDAGWKLPDLAYGAEAWAVLEIDVPRSALPAAGTVQLPLTVSVHGAGPGTAPLFLMGALPALPVLGEGAWDALAVDERVERRVMELDAADALQAMRDAIAKSDWAAAERLLADAEQRFAQHEWTASILAAMRRLIAGRDASFSMKEASYASAALRRRIADRDEGPSITFCLDTPAYVRRKREQGKGRRSH
jgi:Ca-activated chloride channel family protein